MEYVTPKGDPHASILAGAEVWIRPAQRQVLRRYFAKDASLVAEQRIAATEPDRAVSIGRHRLHGEHLRVIAAQFLNKRGEPDAIESRQAIMRSHP
jgi:hypothetical protein